MPVRLAAPPQAGAGPAGDGLGAVAAAVRWDLRRVGCPPPESVGGFRVGTYLPRGVRRVSLRRPRSVPARLRSCAACCSASWPQDFRSLLVIRPPPVGTPATDRTRTPRQEIG